MLYVIITLLVIILIALGVFTFLFIREHEKKPVENTENAEALNEDKVKRIVEESFANYSKGDAVSQERLKAVIETKLLSGLGDVKEGVNQKLGSINESLQQQSKQNAIDAKNVYGELMEKIGSLEKAQKNIDVLNLEIEGLRSVLGNNQDRGKFGEFALERILFSIFGDAKTGVYELQYPLTQTERPDSVVFLDETQKVLCIDSKFPYQEYKRLLDEKNTGSTKQFGQDIKKHIDDIHRKYIIKGETAPYALMFIPSDAIFGFINGELYDIVEYSRSKNVILTSPSTLQPILATINLVKLENERNKNANLILSQLKALSKDFAKFTDDWDTLSKRYNAVMTANESFANRVKQMNKKFEKIDNIEEDEEE